MAGTNATDDIPYGTNTYFCDLLHYLYSKSNFNVLNILHSFLIFGLEEEVRYLFWYPH